MLGRCAYGEMMGRRCCIINIQLLLAAINVLLSVAFVPAALKTVPSRIRPRHYALSSTSSNNIDGDKRYPNDDRIDIITSKIQQGLSTVITSCVIFTAILTSPINSEAIAMTENQQFVVSMECFLCFVSLFNMICTRTYIPFVAPYRQMYGLQ